MEKKLSVLSIVLFSLALPSLIVVDWYWKGYGLLFMFCSLILAVVADQLRRILYPADKGEKDKSSTNGKLLKLAALIFFMSTPVFVIYLDKFYAMNGIIVASISIGCGICLDCFSRIALSKIPRKG